jgi:hypothetical protein
MSKQIVVKTSLNEDIRRFSVKEDCSWSNFKQLMYKLYDVDVTAYRITYKDEEGDDLSITTDEELKEGLRIASEMNPPILRVTLKMTNPLSSSQNLASSISSLSLSSSSIPVVYVSGRAFVPTTVVKPKQYGPKKCSPEDTWSLKLQPTPDSLDTEIDIPISQTTDVYIEKECSSSTVTRVPSSPLVVVINPDSRKLSLAELTASIAESISNMVLESSDSVLKNSAAVSDAVIRDTRAIANNMVDSNLEISSQISRQTQVNCTKSIAAEHGDTIQELANVSQETREASSSISASTSASVNQNSTAILDSVSPISQHTIGLQKAATVGLQENLNKGIDDVIRSIMEATTPTTTSDHKHK